MAETTAAETTAAETTAPETTAAETTAPSTEPPPTTADSTDDDPALAQFCFDSEQVYVFDQVLSQLTEPTPTQAEEALSVLSVTIDEAVESAPPGLDEEPQRLAEALAEIDAGFRTYGYDVEAFGESAEAVALDGVFDEYADIISQLTGFIESQCTTALGVLDSQAVKLAPIIEGLLDLPLRPIANQAGDIRLFVPPEWAESVGSLRDDSTTFLEVTSDVEQFERTWNVPGVLATVTYVGEGAAGLTELLESSGAGADCSLVSSEPYADAVYTGELYLLSDCAGVGTEAAVLGATDAASAVEITLEFQFPGGADRVLLDQMLATFAAGA